MKLSARQRADLWFSKIEWRDYESYVFGTLQRLNPESVVRHNVPIRGKLTGRSRQIDILVERDFDGVSSKIVVDCKCYKRPVDLKHVEAFLAMLEDLGMSKGVMITRKGYSRSALRRAKRGSRRAELRIVSPDRLSEFQHIGDAFLWVEPLAAILDTPEGWVADNEDSRSERAQFAMYTAGHTRMSAQVVGAYLYGNIILKTEIQPDMESIATGHENAIAKKFPAALFKRVPSTHRRFGSTDETMADIFRVGHIDASYRGPEYSIYIDHPKGVLVLVLLCPVGEDNKYLPILKKLAETAQLVNCVDERSRRTRDVHGRVSVYWNRAKYVQVYERANISVPWALTEEYIEISEPLRLQQPKQVHPEPGKIAIESCEFMDRIIPVAGKTRREIVEEGWEIPLWDPSLPHAKPRVILHFCGLEEAALLSDPESLSFFTSTRLPSSSDYWPPVSGVDFKS
jgi:hypothetical protein